MADDNLENQNNVSAEESTVLCDSCVDSPSSKASKSCLTCLVSYCETHLRPHLGNIKFQNHRLVDPLHDISRQTCEVHRLPFERFCLMDECCLCTGCESQDHEGHTTTSLGEARAHIETELQKKEEEFGQSAEAAEKTIEKLQNNKDSVKSLVQDVCVAVEQQFARLQTAVEEARRGVLEVLEGEQNQALTQAGAIQAHLEQRRAELMKTLDQIHKLSRSRTDSDFLQAYSEWKKEMTDVCVPSVRMTCMDHLTSYVHVVTDSTQELCVLILSSYQEKLCKRGPKSLMAESHPPSSVPEPVTREDFLKYARCLTFDPDTVHPFLRIREDNRKLTNTSPWQHSYSDHTARFEYWRQALTSESLYLGRHYIEAELSGEGAHFGVTNKSIDPKGEKNSDCITGYDFSWCVGRNRRGFSAWNAGLETVIQVNNISRIGVYIDFDRGCVSFHNVTGDSMMLLHTYTADFTEPLYVTVWLSKKDDMVYLLNAKCLTAHL